MERDPISIVVIGASGDLARRKLFPALFSLYCQGYLPDSFNIFGFARSDYTDAAFRERITERLTCRYAPGESCTDRMTEFLSRCHYVQGAYGSRDAMLDLYQRMRDVEGEGDVNRLFYLAIPPSVFLDVARAIGDAGLVQCGERNPWSRVVIEKPFGHDRASSDLLTEQLAYVFTEDQTYRIDHYLGKEVVQNLMVLRFANVVFEPLWNRDYIESVAIEWKESIGVEGRGGYFDQYGIIRDVVQNHMLQILALVAMECPVSASAHAIRDAKVAVLRGIRPLQSGDILLGQYAAASDGDPLMPAYRDEPSVPPASRTPTYASIRLGIDNDRWKGVPFTITAGKALDGRENTVRIRFRALESSLFCDSDGGLPANELVIRIQPDEAMTLSVMSKQPGLEFELTPSTLDLIYGAAFADEIPDAYECLLLDVMQGDKSLFIRSDELAAAWDIFSPALHGLEAEAVEPVPYPFGSAGPASRE